MDQANFDQLMMRLDTLNKLLAVIATKESVAPFSDVNNLLKSIGFDEDEIFRILSSIRGEKMTKRYIEGRSFF